MDVFYYLTVVTLVALLGNEEVKVDSCSTSPPGNGQCDGSLLVSNGKACYFGSHNTFASISCSTMYTFDGKTTFTCNKNKSDKTWTPSSAVCSSLEILSSTPIFPATATLLPLHPTLFSTSLHSELLPSEKSLFTSVQASSGTPSLVTYTIMSNTEISSPSITVTSTMFRQLSTSSAETSTSALVTSNPTVSRREGDLVTSNPTVSRREGDLVTSNPTVSRREGDLVTSNPTVSRREGDLDIKAVYIAVPVVVCFIVLLLGVGFLWWRRRTRFPAPLEKRGPGSLITNQVYGTNGIDRSCSLLNVRQSRINEYAEIPLDILNPGETVGDNYQTIDILPEEKDGGKNSYNNCKLSETEFTDSNYSHIGSNNTKNNTSSNNMYAHTQLNNVAHKTEVSLSNDCDDTYNKLHTATLSARKRQEIENTETEYNHASAGGRYPQNEGGDTYSHLNGNMQIPGVSYKKPNQYEDGRKNIESNNLLLSAKDLPSSTSYVFAKELSAKDLSSSTGYEFAKELPAKELPSNTGYAFAKDLENLNNSSGTPEYAKVTKNNAAISKGYETALGTTHNYLVLEPEINPAPTAALFNVIEDVPAESEDTDEARTGHEYFTLEKS